MSYIPIRTRKNAGFECQARSLQGHTISCCRIVRLVHIKPSKCKIPQDISPIPLLYNTTMNGLHSALGMCLSALHGDDHPPATSTHSGRQLPCFPSTSTMSVSHLHRQPTPFSFSRSHESNHSSSSLLAFSSSVVISRNGGRSN